MYVAPFVNVPNNNGESNEESSDNIAVEVVASFLGGVILLTFIIVLFTACNGVKKTKNLFEGFYECCCEGCLSVLRVLDIRRYFRHIQRYFCIMCVLWNLSWFSPGLKSHLSTYIG